MIFNLDLNQCVTKVVLKILADKLTTKQIEKLRKTFFIEEDLLECNIEWRQLEPKLISMSRKDVVDEIKMTTEITNGEFKCYTLKRNMAFST